VRGGEGGVRHRRTGEAFGGIGGAMATLPATPQTNAAAFRDGGRARIALLFTGPDPCEWNATRPGRPPLSPEQRLMLAVLERAVDDLQGRIESAGDKWGPRHPKPWISAPEWVASEDTTWAFSFRNCCAALGLDPDYLRRGLSLPASKPTLRIVTRDLGGQTEPREMQGGKA
jgi:hypothetical protein